MNQIKYLVYACLMIFTAAILSIFIATLSSNEIIAPLPTTIDVDLPKQDNVMTNSKGGNLFRQNCQSCHALDKNLTGPALRGVHERGPWTNRSNLIKMGEKYCGIHSNNALYKGAPKNLRSYYAFF